MGMHLYHVQLIITALQVLPQPSLVQMEKLQQLEQLVVVRVQLGVFVLFNK